MLSWVGIGLPLGLLSQGAREDKRLQLLPV